MMSPDDVGRGARRRRGFSRASRGRYECRRRRAVVTARGDVGSGPRLRDLARRRHEGDRATEWLVTPIRSEL